MEYKRETIEKINETKINETGSLKNQTDKHLTRLISRKKREHK